MSPPLRRASIILCGGESSRMGFPKAWLPFGPERMLQRVVRLLADVTPTRIVVAAAGMELPPLPPGIIVVRDEREARGPLEGIRAGLQAAAPIADVCYVTGCDVPLLAPEFVRRMFVELEDFEICVPQEDRYLLPLAAVYRVCVLPAVEKLLAADRLRTTFLIDEMSTRRLNVEALREVDPNLATLRNLNRPEDYFAALAEAGLSLTSTEPAP